MRHYALLVLMLSLAACTRSGDPGDTAGDTAGKPIGTIEAIEGEAFVVHGVQRVAATVGAELGAGDQLQTGATGKIRAKLSDQSVLAIGAGTRLQLSTLTLDGGNRTARVEVLLGKFWMQITKWTGTGASSYEIATPNAVAGVRGTTLWGDTEVDAICALEGSIEVRSIKDAALAPARLDAGNCAAELSRGKLSPLAPTPEQIAGYLGEVLIPAP